MEEKVLQLFLFLEQLHLNNQPETVLCIGCTRRNREDNCCSLPTKGVWLNIPSQIAK